MKKKLPLAVLTVVVLGTVSVGCGGSSETTPTGTEPAASAEAPAEAPATSAQPAVEAQLGSASIRGTVKFEGEVPKLRPVPMDSDPGCAAKHTEPVAPEILVVGEGQTLANVYVSVEGGLPEGTWPIPTEPAVLDQKGCLYVPHVLGVMVNQPLRILNSDGLMHNVHAMPKVNKSFNMAMPASLTETLEKFTRVEEMFTIKCDVHPWMKAYVAVSSHPFFNVTGTDGVFEIDRLPAGTYEIEAWHEKLGTRTASVTVGDGASETVDFTFAR
jgi:plastocyanin